MVEAETLAEPEDEPTEEPRLCAIERAQVAWVDAKARIEPAAEATLQAMQWVEDGDRRGCIFPQRLQAEADAKEAWEEAGRVLLAAHHSVGSRLPIMWQTIGQTLERARRGRASF